MISGLNETILTQWIEKCLKDNSNTLSSGYQGKILLYTNNSQKIVIKVPHGRGLMKYINTVMLRHEYRIYKKLGDFSGSPECYGMIGDKYLVIEHIAGQSIREKRPANDEIFFNELLALIQEMHNLQIAHMDLKRKDNLLVTDSDHPCLIDFGTSVAKKCGFHPINHFLYKLAMRFDYNAWIKHKYHNKMDDISDEDRAYYRQTLTEKYAGLIKKAYTKIKSHINKKT
jgi:serine/threonine protein kinase